MEISNISDTQQEIMKMVSDIQNRTSTQVDDSWAHEIDYFVSSWPISDQDGLKMIWKTKLKAIPIFENKF